MMETVCKFEVYPNNCEEVPPLLIRTKFTPENNVETLQSPTLLGLFSPRL